MNGLACEVIVVNNRSADDTERVFSETTNKLSFMLVCVNQLLTQ